MSGRDQQLRRLALEATHKCDPLASPESQEKVRSCRCWQFRRYPMKPLSGHREPVLVLAHSGPCRALRAYFLNVAVEQCMG